MVPNHVGIVSRWVIEHPDWFVWREDNPYPWYTYGGPDLSNDDRVAIHIEDHYYDRTDAAVVFRRTDRHTGHAAVRLPRQRRHQHAVERHGAAQLPEPRGPRGRHPDDPPRGAAVPGDPLRRGDDAGQAPFPAALVPRAGDRRRHPDPRRGRDDEGRVQRRDAGRVLARGGGPGRGRGAEHAAAGRGVLAAGGVLRPDARDAPGLQQRVHGDAARRGQRQVPPGHEEHAGVRSGGAAPLRQLHEQPGRAYGGRPVRHRATSISASAR